MSLNSLLEAVMYSFEMCLIKMKCARHTAGESMQLVSKRVLVCYFLCHSKLVLSYFKLICIFSKLDAYLVEYCRF